MPSSLRLEMKRALPTSSFALLDRLWSAVLPAPVATARPQPPCCWQPILKAAQVSQNSGVAGWDNQRLYCVSSVDSAWLEGDPFPSNLQVEMSTMTKS